MCSVTLRGTHVNDALFSDQLTTTTVTSVSLI